MALVAKRMAVVGVGLIGGSLAGAARQAGAVERVVGIGRTRGNLETALQRGLIDEIGNGPAAVSGVDLVVLAVPLGSLIETAQRLRPHIGPGTLITDVGSVKAAVVASLTQVFSTACPFVGAHPIAGTERSGARFADPDMFRGARCVVTPGVSAPESAVRRVERLWEAVGAEVLRMSPEEHDRVLAWTSHLGHVVAFALARGLAREGAGRVVAAGPSLRDMTRVAASSPELWADVLMANRSALLEALDEFAQDVGHLRRALERGDERTVRAWLDKGRGGRRLLEDS